MKRAYWRSPAFAIAAWVLMWGVPCAAATFTFYPYAELASVYTDNASHYSSSDAHGDFIATELLSGSLQADASEKHFALDYSTVESQYISTPSLNRAFQDHFVGTSYDQRISPGITLSVNDSLLVGDGVSSTIITGNQIPIGSQLLQGLLARSSSRDNLFNAGLSYSEPQSWDLGTQVRQLFFSGGGGASGESFGQGIALTADRPLGGYYWLGAGYSFDDFRFESQFPRAESHWPQMRLTWQPDLNYYVLVRGGPILMGSFAGASSGVYRSGGWSINPGGLVQARYSNPRFVAQLEGGQQPGLGAGLAGAALNRSVSLLLQYAASRSVSLFIKQGFLEVSARDRDSKLITYSIGATWLLSRKLFVTAQYYSMRNIYGGGSGARAAGAESGTRLTTNMFLIGATWQSAPIRWRW